MTQNIAPPEDEDLHDPDDFGENDPDKKQPFWKRELLFGYTLPWILGVVFLALAGFGYLFGPSLISDTPSESSFSEVENTLDGAGTGNSGSISVSHEPVSAPVVSPASAPAVPALPATPVMSSDTMALMADIRDELNARDKTMKGSLDALKDVTSQLADAIKRDEAYALESRNQLTELTRRLAMLEARQSTGDVPKPTPHTASTSRRQSASPVSSMKVVSLENGMAWIKWQGSTWAVREGDALGNVTIRRIDPASRSVQTSGGTLR